MSDRNFVSLDIDQVRFVADRQRQDSETILALCDAGKEMSDLANALKKERDDLKIQLEGAQKEIALLKAGALE